MRSQQIHGYNVNSRSRENYQTALASIHSFHVVTFAAAINRITDTHRCPYMLDCQSILSVSAIAFHRAVIASLNTFIGHVVWHFISAVPCYHFLCRVRALHDGAIQAWVTAKNRAIPRHHLASFCIFSVLLVILETRYWSTQGTRLKKHANARLRCMPLTIRSLFKRKGAVQTREHVEFFIGYLRHQVEMILLPRKRPNHQAIYLLLQGSSTYIGRTCILRQTQQWCCGALQRWKEHIYALHAHKTDNVLPKHRRSRYMMMRKELACLYPSILILVCVPDADASAMEAAFMSICLPNRNNIEKHLEFNYRIQRKANSFMCQGTQTGHRP